MKSPVQALERLFMVGEGNRVMIKEKISLRITDDGNEQDIKEGLNISIIYMY